MRSRRHLIFATTEQLEILSKVKQWHVDGTFKLCREPFTQLFTINAFTRQDEFVKQVPLVHVLMSGRRKKDYKRVLNEILELLPYAPRVKEVTTDFEAAVWGVFSEVLPSDKMKGCAFHWNQAVWRKVQELGLQTAYSTDKPTHDYIRQLMALPFLPHESILATFTTLNQEANTAPLKDLVRYIDSIWMQNETWLPKAVECVYANSQNKQ